MPVSDLRSAIARRLGTTGISRIYLGSEMLWEPPAIPDRIAVPLGDDIAASAHSFLDTATGVTGSHGGNLVTTWGGTIHQTYLSGSWLSARWDENGPDRTAAGYSAFIFTEFGDPSVGGYAAPDSPQGIETLQYAYWHVLNAQNKGALLACLYWAWTPGGIEDLGMTRAQADADTMAKAEYVRQWLNARPEITIPVYAIPLSAYVTQMLPIAEQYNPEWPVFADEIGHFNSSWQETDESLSWLVWMMLRAEKAPEDPARSDFLQACVDLGWTLLTQYECTGLGVQVIDPIAVAGDPLPNPEPLPTDPEPETYLAEITTDPYSGPPMTGALPAVIDGHRTFAAAEPAPVAIAPVETSQTLYMIGALRVTAMPNGGKITVFGFNDGVYGAWPGLWMMASGWTGRWEALLEDGGVGTTVESEATSMNGTWQTIEVWADGPELNICVDGGEVVSATSAGDGVWEVSDLDIARDESSGASFDLAAFRASSTIPDEAGRAAMRAWAQGYNSGLMGWWQRGSTCQDRGRHNDKLTKKFPCQSFRHVLPKLARRYSRLTICPEFWTGGMPR